MACQCTNSLPALLNGAGDDDTVSFGLKIDCDTKVHTTACQFRFS